jgi:GAF domain-containing protein
MIPAPIFPQEDKRLEAVHRLGLMDNFNLDKRANALTREAVEKLGVPISTLTVLDENREYYRSNQGLDAKDGERSISFCGHALMQKDLMIVPDCKKDERFADNPMVIGKPYIRFYAGMALFDYRTHLPVAVFCIKDTKPRNLSMEELNTFLGISTRAEELINGVSDKGMTKE